LKIDELEPQKISTKFPEDMLFEAIEEYIEKSNFPNDIIFRKLELLDKNMKMSIKEVESLISRGSLTIETLMNKTQDLSTKCNNLLYKLRKNFSN